MGKWLLENLENFLTTTLENLETCCGDGFTWWMFFLPDVTLGKSIGLLIISAHSRNTQILGLKTGIILGFKHKAITCHRYQKVQYGSFVPLKWSPPPFF